MVNQCQDSSAWVPLESAVGPDVLRAEVWAWAARIGMQPKEVHIRPMKRKWGSCSSNGRLTLNSDLFHQPAERRAEVIVHELLHLRYPNHGRLFRSLVRAFLRAARDDDRPLPSGLAYAADNA